MVVKQANITSYKVSDPSEILDRRPVSCGKSPRGDEEKISLSILWNGLVYEGLGPETHVFKTCRSLG